MNTKSVGILAKADLYDNLSSLKINKVVLDNVEKHVLDEELELVVHEYLKIINPKIKDTYYINNLVETISEIKTIPVDFYKYFWTSIGEEIPVNQKIEKLITLYPSIENKINKNILKEVLSEMVNLLLRSYPIDIELLREYKEKLRTLIEEE